MKISVYPSSSSDHGNQRYSKPTKTPFKIADKSFGMTMF